MSETPAEPVAEHPDEPVAEPVARRRPRRLPWIAAALGVLVTATGVVVAVRGFAATGGPDGAVRGYFAALADGDAASALAYGTIPSGSRALLTDRVLHAQLDAAAIRNVAVDDVVTNGDAARVRVRYTLAFTGSARDVTAEIDVHRRDGDWRLDRTAVPTQLLLDRATDRATILGTPVPDGTVLVFPGAAPITLDTDLLQLQPEHGSVAPDAGTTTTLEVGPTAKGKRAVLDAVGRGLARCLGANAEQRCPLPSERYVPGSIRGSLAGTLGPQLTVEVTTAAAGEFEVTGDVKVRGSFRRLEFDNRLTSKTGAAFTLPVDAHVYAAEPLTVRWERPA